jgi:hypothetical protein
VTALVAAAGYTDVSDYASDTAARHKDAIAVLPDLLEFVMKLLVILNQAELALVVRVFL